LKIGVNDES